MVVLKAKVHCKLKEKAKLAKRNGAEGKFRRAQYTLPGVLAPSLQQQL